MADIKFTGNKTLATINKEWLAKFPFMYIRFVGHGDWKVTHAAVRTKKDAADLSTNAGMNVGTFETRHNDAYGAQVELCYVKNGRMYRSLGEQNALTLNEFNAFAKEKGGVEIITAHPEWFEHQKDTDILRVGSKYAGGIVFYLDKTGSHGLVCSDKDFLKVTWAEASRLCLESNHNSYNDWRLPTKDELNLLYQNRDVVGGFANDKYWSSTDYSHDGMWVCRFNDGSQGAYHKDQFNFYVRAVRAF